MAHEIDPIAAVAEVLGNLAVRCLLVLGALGLGVQLGLLVASHWQPGITPAVILEAPRYYPMLMVASFGALWGILAYPVIFLLGINYIFREVPHKRLLLVLLVQAAEVCRLGIMNMG